MSEAKKRKFLIPEFKAKAGLEALRRVKTINEIGQEFGAHPITVGKWKKEIQEQVKTLFEGKRGHLLGRESAVTIHKYQFYSVD